VNDPDPNSKDDQVTLELLDAIEQRSDVSQRHLAAKLGIALGLTNSYLKRCARKGYVKVKEVPANRYLYYLTPKGFAEKSRLTARFLSTSLTFYRQSAESCSELYRLCEQRRWRKVVLCGVSDLAEIAYTRSAGNGVDVLAIYDPGFQGSTVLSLPVQRRWGRVEGADAYIITDLADPLSTYRGVMSQVAEPERVLVPRVLGLDAAIRNSK
jgi:DNA-binding MarR family transcriptional regulator